MRPASIGTLLTLACGLGMMGCCGGCVSHAIFEEIGVIQYGFYLDSWAGSFRWVMGGLAMGIVNGILLYLWWRSRPSSPTDK